MEKVFVIWSNGCGEEFSCTESNIIAVTADQELANQYMAASKEFYRDPVSCEDAVPLISSQADLDQLRLAYQKRVALGKLSHEEKELLGLLPPKVEVKPPVPAPKKIKGKPRA